LSNKPPTAIIGGSGVKSIIKGDEKTIGTPYGPSPPITHSLVAGRSVYFLPRHGEHHQYPPHMVNYRANIWALRQLGVERIIATNAVGGINQELTPGDIVIPVDIIDMTKSRKGTFYDKAPVTHIDVSQPYCPTLRRLLIDTARTKKVNVHENIAMAATEGPRYETPAEIRMLRTVGCGIVGMTGAPEAFLARELQLCYASISFVSNMAAGLQRQLSAREVEEKGRETSNILNSVIVEAVANIPERHNDCPCSNALVQAQLVSNAAEVEQLAR